MKRLKLGTVMALSATILAGGSTLVAGQEVREVTTNGRIQFEADTESELEVIPPVTDPDVEIAPEVPGTTGPLSIIKAPTMNFGSQVISNQDQSYAMIAEMAPLAAGTGEVPYVSFAQVQDVRGTNEGWELQVSLSDFKSNTQNDTLIGAEIELVGASVQYEGNNVDNAPVAHANHLKLLPNGAARSVMSAPTGKGAGVSSIVWGDQTALTAQFTDDDFDAATDIVENEAIQLSIPGATAKDATTYTSTLTWELTSTPGEEVSVD